MSIGTILPTLVSWHGNFLQAEAYQTYRVPRAQHFFNTKTRGSYLKQTIEVWSKTNKDALRPIGTSWAIQLVFEMFIFDCKIENLLELFFTQVLVSFLIWQQQKEYFEKIEPINFRQSEIDQVIAMRNKK